MLEKTTRLAFLPIVTKAAVLLNGGFFCEAADFSTLCVDKEEKIKLYCLQAWRFFDERGDDMRRLFRWLAAFLTVACAGLWGLMLYFQHALPDALTVNQGEGVHIGRLVEGHLLEKSQTVAAMRSGDTYRAQLRLAGLFPMKEVSVSVVDTPVVMVCGTPFGIKLYTDGVLIVGLSDVMTAAGAYNPAAAAGVCVGDTILSVNGQTVNTNRQVSKLINACGGNQVTLRLRRDGVEFEAKFLPVRPRGEEGYRAGLWVRDSTAGIGTLTFYEPSSGRFAGLGHAVCDVDTGEQLAISGGEIVPARIFDVEKSVSGTPGELCGAFELGTLGRLQYNGADGLYGKLTVYPIGWKTLPVARAQEVEKGAAQILTTLDGSTPQLYDVSIEHVKYTASAQGRHMILRVTDARLLEKAGGIVQGMSGSPIIQNGKLIGAVTHVLVDDPTKGYGIFAENMLETAQSVAEEKQLKDAS